SLRTIYCAKMQQQWITLAPSFRPQNHVHKTRTLSRTVAVTCAYSDDCHSTSGTSSNTPAQSMHWSYPQDTESSAAGHGKGPRLKSRTPPRTARLRRERDRGSILVGSFVKRDRSSLLPELPLT